MAYPRNQETAAKYKEYLTRLPEGACPLCDEPALKQFTYWKITHNNFPYDAIVSTHDMIMPLRHTDEVGVSKEEWMEFEAIKRDYIHATYSFILENMGSTRSIPKHFHLHLMRYKLDA